MSEVKAYIESGDFIEKFALVLDLLPEKGEVALLEDVCDVDDLLHGLIAHLGRQQQILAEYEIAEREIRQRLQQNQVCDLEVQRVRVELVEFEDCQVGVEVVGVLLGLLLNIFLEEWKVIRIVAKN